MCHGAPEGDEWSRATLPTDHTPSDGLESYGESSIQYQMMGYLVPR